MMGKKVGWQYVDKGNMGTVVGKCGVKILPAEDGVDWANIHRTNISEGAGPLRVELD